LQQALEDVSLEEANKTIGKHNSIRQLVFHLHYYAKAFSEVLKGNPLNATDKEAFKAPEFNSESEWLDYLNGIYVEAKEIALLIERLPLEKLNQNIPEEKYGTYFRNLAGIIEHAHYHLGQIVLLKKLYRSN